MTREATVQVGNRSLAYLETGDPSGPLVLHSHGGPSNRLEAQLFAASAKAHGLRLVGVDRPGIGGSDPEPGRSFASWGDVLLALAAAAYLDPARLALSAASRGPAIERSGPTGRRVTRAALMPSVGAWRCTSSLASVSWMNCSA